MGVKGIAADGTVITDDRYPARTAKVDTQGGLQTGTAGLSPAGIETLARLDEGGNLRLAQDTTLDAILIELKVATGLLAMLVGEPDVELLRAEMARDTDLGLN